MKCLDNIIRYKEQPQMLGTTTKYGMRDSEPHDMRLCADVLDVLKGEGYEPETEGWDSFV